jgi:hypothetical protein
MVVPAQWHFLWAVKNLVWEVVKKVSEVGFGHFIYCVWIARKVFGWFRVSVWPLIEVVLLGSGLVLLKVPAPVKVTELDPRVLRIWFELYKRQ